MNKKIFILLFILSFGLFLVGCKTPSLSLLEKNVTLKVGETYEIKSTVSGVKGDDIFNYNVSDSTIVSVANNTVSALKAGTATIEVSLKNYPECADTLTIIVKEQPKIVITGNDSVYVNETIELSTQLIGVEGEVTWKSSDETIATVTNGEVTGVKGGKVIITAKSGDVEATKEITVIANIVTITGEATIEVGKNTQLIAKLNGEEVTSAEWESSDKKIATVYDGFVKGINAGNVIITATIDGIVGEFNLEVTPKRTIEISGATELDLNTTATLKAILENFTGTVVWSSSDSAVVSVDENGLIRGESIGTATITATCDDLSATIEVAVVIPEDKITYYHEGGASDSIYTADENTVSLTVNGNEEIDYWTYYATNIFLYSRSEVVNATFSDRISIGKNEYTGYWQVLDICTSGKAEWPEGTEYVIVLSNSYNDFKNEHIKVEKIAKGSYVFFEKDPATVNNTNPSIVYFASSKIEGDVAVVKKDNYKGELITPTRLGFEFLGWYNEEDEKVELLVPEQIQGNVRLYAKWNELNPVTGIEINEIPDEMVTGDTFQIEAKVTPNDAFFQEVLFSTSDKDTINVSENGLLTSKNPGTVTITLQDFLGKFVHTYEITVYSIASIDVKFDDEYTGVLNVGETLQLEPSYLGKAIDDLSFTYTSSNSSVATVDATGLVTAVANGDVKITIKSSNDKELEIGVTVEGLSQSDKIDEVIKLIVNGNQTEVEVGNMCLYNDSRNRYYAATYGSVNRFLFEDLVFDNTYHANATQSSNGGKRSKSDIQFVTVHDTATLTGTAANIANNMTKVNSGVSIHYVVGDGKVYACLPEDYVAYHAGDGTGTTFKWLASGVAGVAGVQPDFDLVQDGNKYYFTINGQKTNVECPVSNGSNKIANPSKEYFSHLGPTWTVIDGEYYIGTPWASFGQVAAGVISSRGGNNNSVGIEMAVNTTGDIYDTFQRNAKLVADILIRNDLDLTRVKQHNTFDGKNCPQSLIAGNYWTEFMEMVEINYILQKDYSDIKITMVSDNPNIVANNGRVVNAPTIATTVGYTVTVSSGTTSKTIKLYSVVPGTTSWQRLEGSYTASLIWNDGNFAVNK